MNHNYNYIDLEIPESAIAVHPLESRDTCKLLVTDNDGIQDLKFFDLEKYLVAGDLLVMNNSKVVPAKMTGHKLSGGKVEVLFIESIDPYTAKCMVKTSKSLKIDSVFIIDNTNVSVIDKLDNGHHILKSEKKFSELMDESGLMPIPPYIPRDSEQKDFNSYQTVYAKTKGSIAAPTAGLHFTKDLLSKLEEKGVNLGYVTLHVGLGTFLPLKTKNIKEHNMHTEKYSIDQDLIDKIKLCKKNGNRVIAVGTTSVRSLESLALKGELKSGNYDTSLFITPGFNFKLVDSLVTNFHLPDSTLIVMMCAILGADKVLKIYKHALHHDYKFFSYGDSMFIPNIKNNKGNDL